MQIKNTEIHDHCRCSHPCNGRWNLQSVTSIMSFGLLLLQQYISANFSVNNKVTRKSGQSHVPNIRSIE